MLALICLLAYETAVACVKQVPEKFIPTSFDLLKTNKWLNGCTFDVPAVTCVFAVR